MNICQALCRQVIIRNMRRRRMLLDYSDAKRLHLLMFVSEFSMIRFKKIGDMTRLTCDEVFSVTVEFCALPNEPNPFSTPSPTPIPTDVPATSAPGNDRCRIRARASNLNGCPTVVSVTTGRAVRWLSCRVLSAPA